MHELSIVQSILDSVGKEAHRLQISRINKIFVSIGVLSGVEKEALAYNYSLLPQKKPFVGTKLIIQENVLVVYCPACQKETTVTDGFTLQCATCGKLTSHIVKGKELTIDTIEY